MTGINPNLAIDWLNATVRNTPFVVPLVAIQLHTGDPGGTDASSNISAVTTRAAASFATPVEASNVVTTTTTGAPPSWTMTAAETISYISVWPALTGGTYMWIARLNTPQTVAAGDVFTMGGGITLSILGLAA